MGRLARAWSRLERFAERPAASPALLGIALVDYAIVSVAFPLAEGRDLGTYLRASHELLSADVVLPQALLMRAPVTGLVAEGLISAGPLAAEAAMAALYALSILCWWRVARRVGTGTGVVFAVVLLMSPSFVLLFHRLASDALYAAAFSLGALLAARTIERATTVRIAALGAGFALLVLIRPVSQSLILLVPLLLFLPGTWRGRVGRLAVFAVAAVLPLLVWAGHNAVRADDFTVVRGAGHGLPLYRAFVVDRIVDPENGEASRELAEAVRRDLLVREPYRGYGIDLEEFFSSGSARMHEDLIGLADRTWGWDDDYAHLARVGREAVRAHPDEYARSVAQDTWRLLWWPLFLDIETSGGQGARWLSSSSQALPEPSEGQPIPSASVSGFISTPDGRFREVWTSPIEHEILADDPADAAHLDRLNVRVNELASAFSDRAGHADLGGLANSVSRWFPRPVVWLLVGIAAVAVRRPKGIATPVVLAAGALLLLVATALAVPATAEYSTPVAPAFILLAIAGLLAPRRTRPRRMSSAR